MGHGFLKGMCVHLLLPQAAIPLCKLYGTSHFLLVRPCGRGEGGCQMERAVFLSSKKPNFMDGFLMVTECIMCSSQKVAGFGDTSRAI